MSSPSPDTGRTEARESAPHLGERVATWVAAVCSAACLVAWGLYLSAFALDLPDPDLSRGGPSPRTFSYLFIAVAGLAAAGLAVSYVRRAVLLPKDPDRARERPTRWSTACWCALVATAVSIWRPGDWAVVAVAAGLVWAASAVSIARLGRRP
jgi:hypothetical protein